MNLNAISIAQLNQYIAQKLKDIQAEIMYDDIIITNNIGYNELFRYPCRLDAVTILVCTSGELCGMINLNKYTTNKNGIVVSLPEDIIQIVSMKDFEAYAVVISATLLREAHIDIQKLLSLHLGINHYNQIYLSDDELYTLKHYHTLAVNAINSTDNGHKYDIIQGIIYSLIHQVIAFIKEKEATNSPVYTKAIQHNETLFNKFMTLLNTNHTKEHSVKFYASSMNITANHLSYVIKEFSGKTASEWINEYVV
ncbi:MAG: hypothetical protein RSB93_04420, partial [Rikenellaceae bacterium]